MAFERYIKSRLRSYIPIVSIYTRGLIWFNRLAVQQFHILDYKFSLAFYERETRRIGFKFTNNPEEGSIMKITHTTKGDCASVFGKLFLEFYNIPHEKLQKYPIVYNEEELLYVIDLSQAIHKMTLVYCPLHLRKVRRA